MLLKVLSARYRPLTAAAALFLSVSVLIVAVSTRWIDVRAREQADLTAAEQADKKARLLASELQKFRLLPVVLSEYPDLHAVLDGGDPNAVASLNNKLEFLAKNTRASAIYVIRRDGLTLASSNWRSPGSFVGQNFSFRPYFRGALASREADLFAVGSVTGAPGLFVARRIDEGSRALGVVVVKIDFAELEAQWARELGRTMVIDSHGVVIITGYDPWRFRSTRAVSASEREEFRSTLQFGSLGLAPLGLTREVNGDLRLPDHSDTHRVAETPTAMHGARLFYFEPLEPARARISPNVRLIALISLAVAAGILAIFWWLHIGRLVQADRRHLLEAEVSLRTSELKQANNRLRSESHRRMSSEARWRAAREELAQANRLAVIGQITTGIAHEVNQPVAAIRAFAENARQHLNRTDIARTDSRLNDIIDLTDRIGRITTELRNFARRGAPVVSEAPLGEAIDGAILLIADRIRAEQVTLERSPLPTEITVIADKTRLEQILINLVQNALDALRHTSDPHIAILVNTDDAVTVTVTVADNGPGVPAAMTSKLFAPFATDKPDGLGLGLGIARDIARAFGGALNLVESPLGGAAFCITLRRAA
ncbi:MAG: ATP-binding protein [Pseudomonadota bacterium]